jgi:cell wall-associated NlpC family hydrolase
VVYALSRQGGRYRLGATRYSHNVSEREFDCSSLVNWCFWRVGIHIPDLILPKIEWFKKNGGRQVSVSAGLKIRGAIMIRTVIKSGNRHIGISIGNGKTIEAVGTAYGVRTMDRSTSDWQQAWLSPKLKYGTDAAKYL